ncbi:hypothetical protein BDR03DRAFT_951128 [Suillus americanus]|nr:hypothetical protein BDR03DRAFT_951128 [Suillus americanus]
MADDLGHHFSIIFGVSLMSAAVLKQLHCTTYYDFHITGFDFIPTTRLPHVARHGA